MLIHFQFAWYLCLSTVFLLSFINGSFPVLRALFNLPALTLRSMYWVKKILTSTQMTRNLENRLTFEIKGKGTKSSLFNLFYSYISLEVLKLETGIMSKSNKKLIECIFWFIWNFQNGIFCIIVKKHTDSSFSALAKFFFFFL